MNCSAILGDPPPYSKKVAHSVAGPIEAPDTVTDNDEGDMVIGEALSAIRDNVDDWEVTVDDVLGALAAMYTAAAPDAEFHLLPEHETDEPPPRMAYRPASTL